MTKNGKEMRAKCEAAGYKFFRTVKGGYPPNQRFTYHFIEPDGSSYEEDSYSSELTAVSVANSRRIFNLQNPNVQFFQAGSK